MIVKIIFAYHQVDKFPKVDIGNNFSSYVSPTHKRTLKGHDAQSNSKGILFQQNPSTLKVRKRNENQISMNYFYSCVFSIYHNHNLCIISKDPIDKDTEKDIYDRIRAKRSDRVKGKESPQISSTSTTESISSGN